MAGTPPGPGQTITNGSWDPSQLPPAPITGGGLRASLGMGVPRPVPPPKPVGYATGTSYVGAKSGGPGAAVPVSIPDPAPVGGLAAITRGMTVNQAPPLTPVPPVVGPAQGMVGRGMPAAPLDPTKQGTTTFSPSGQYQGATTPSLPGAGPGLAAVPVKPKPLPMTEDQQQAQNRQRATEILLDAGRGHPGLLTGYIPQQASPQSMLQQELMKFHAMARDAAIQGKELPPAVHNAYTDYFNKVSPLIGPSPALGPLYNNAAGMVDPNATE